MLDGVRVIEIEGIGPGPFAAMMLADLGAEVITVHRPGGAAQDHPSARLLDRGKKSILLDLKCPADCRTARDLIAISDALVEGFRPGVMERLGLGPDICMADNPALVYGRMTGWGQDGPKSGMAGHDLNYIATSGALWYASEPGRPPLTPPSLLGDVGGGALYLVAGILAGLIKSRSSGTGTVVDAAIVDGSAHMMALLMSLAPRMERGQSLLDGPHWSRTYACADGGFMSVQCLERKFYDTFLGLMGLSQDPDFNDQHDPRQWPLQTARLAGLFASASTDHWATLLEGTDACAAPVLSPEAAARDPHMMARGTWQQQDGVLQPAPAPRFSDSKPSSAQLPDRGQHDAEIRAILARTG